MYFFCNYYNCSLFWLIQSRYEDILVKKLEETKKYMKHIKWIITNNNNQLKYPYCPQGIAVDDKIPDNINFFFPFTISREYNGAPLKII